VESRCESFSVDQLKQLREGRGLKTVIVEGRNLDERKIGDKIGIRRQQAGESDDVSLPFAFYSVRAITHAKDAEETAS